MRVSFRRVREADLRRLNELVNDEQVSRYLSVTPPVPMKKTRDFFESLRKSARRWYAVLVDGQVAGAAGISPKPRDCKQAHVAEVGIDLDPRIWGKGVGEKAMGHLLGEAKKMGLKRLELQLVKENKRALNLYLKSGYKVEGTKKKAFKLGRGYVDVYIMGRWIR